MATSYYTAACRIRISKRLRDYLEKVTYDTTFGDRHFTPEFVNLVRAKHPEPQITMTGECAITLTCPLPEDPDTRPMLKMAIGYCDDWANAGEWARLLQYALVDSGADDIIYFDWIEGCSKDRPSEVVGAICRVTRTDIKMLSTKSLIRAMIENPGWADKDLNGIWSTPERGLYIDPSKPYHPSPEFTSVNG